MKRFTFSLLLAVAASVFFSGCQKNTSPDSSQAAGHSLIDQAQAYFNASVLGHPATINGANPRTKGAKLTDWTQARTVEFAHRPAVLVPVQYSRPFLVMTSFSGGGLFNINSRVQLLIFSDSSGAFHAQVVSSFPDSSCATGGPFKGVILVDDWNGNSLSRYQYDGNSVRVFRPVNPGPSSGVPATRVAPSTYTITYSCVIIYGYNYAGNDPNDGYYWSETVGCDTEGEGEGAGGSGGNYSNLPGSGGGGSGGSGNSTNFTILSGTNPIGNITDYIKCFTNVPGTDHAYQVTVCVDQPEPGTRTTWGFDGSGSSSSQNPFDVGHAFLALTEISPTGTITRNVGLYPQSNVTPASPSDKPQLNNDEGHSYNISLTITLTNAQFFTMMNNVEQSNNGSILYNLNSNNCTNFALNTLSSAGINLPSTIGFWPGGHGNNPGDLGEDIRQMPLSPNMTRNTVYNYHPNQGTCN